MARLQVSLSDQGLVILTITDKEVLHVPLLRDEARDLSAALKKAYMMTSSRPAIITLPTIGR